MPGRAHFQLRAVFAAFGVLLFASCSKGAVPSGERSELDAKSAASVFARPFITARPSSSSLWFEFGPDGPVSISGPADSALTPFEPWPLAHRAAGLVARDGSVTFAVNRDGFLSFVPRKDGEIAVYRVGDAARFGPYSIASVFLYKDSPTALLYRDRFFIDPTDKTPDPRACSLVKGSPELVSVDLPIFSAYPVAESWDIEALGKSMDGRWVAKAVRAGGLSYASAPSLDDAKTEISAADYRSALLPRSAQSAEGNLKAVFDASVADLAPKKAVVATVVGSGDAYAETYVLSKSKASDAETILAASGENIDRCWAFRDSARALLLFSDGSLIVSASAEAGIGRGRLPALPENFAYTGIAAVNKTLVALWEEQDGWAVGSSGFLLVDAGF